jgi:hypothetical protein
MPNSREALTKPDLSQKALAGTRAPRAGNARSEITALAEPYMLTIQGGERSMRDRGWTRVDRKGVKKPNKNTHRAKQLRESRRGRFLGQAQSGNGSAS